MALSKKQHLVIKNSSEAIRKYVYERCNLCDTDMPWDGSDVEWIYGKPWDLDETVQEALSEVCGLELDSEDLKEAIKELNLTCPGCGNQWESGILVSYDPTAGHKEKGARSLFVYNRNMQPIKTKLQLDGRWNLEDLSEAMKGYTQLYGFAYSLLAELPIARREEIDYIYGKFPWRGGYSTVNFFNQLFHKIPPKHRPEVERIQYASPGYIEVSALFIAVGLIARSIKEVCSAIDTAHVTYRNIQKGSIEHELAKINLTKEQLNLTQKQLTFCETASKSLVKIFGFTKAENQLLDKRVQGNRIMKLKILLSVFRRIWPLAKMQNEGKLNITGEISDSD